MNSFLEARRQKIERELATVNRRIDLERKRLLALETQMAQAKAKAA